MKTAHQIKIKVFSYEKNSDDEKLILNKFLHLFPFGLKDEKIELKKTEAKGFHENKITVFEVTLAKDRHINDFLTNLARNIDDGQKKTIISQSESRLDDNFNFYLRFDKSEYLKNNKLLLTDSGNCFHIEISVAAFPKTRENGLEAVRKVFG